MSIHEGRGQLGGAMKDLINLWRQVRTQWKDSAADDFERTFLVVLEQDARNTASAMDTMAAILSQAKRDCE